MSPTTITALAAVFGSLSGGLASSVSTWIAQRYQSRHDLLVRRIMSREQLYSDFISESTRALADAMQHDLKDASSLIPAYALLSRIRLSSSEAVLASADQVLKNIVRTYAEPNLSPEEIRAKGINGTDDPLREFSEICRRDLEAMQARSGQTELKTMGRFHVALAGWTWVIANRSALVVALRGDPFRLPLNIATRLQKWTVSPNTAGQLLDLAITKTIDDVIIYHSDGLHVGINDRRTNETESAMFKVLAESIGLG